MTEESNRKIDVEITKMLAEISKLNAETSKLTTESRWYPIVATAALFGAAITVVKLFMS